MQSFSELLSKLNTVEEYESALFWLLTEKEKEAVENRLQIFQGLLVEKSHQQIAVEVHVSTATVSKASKFLQSNDENELRALLGGA